MENLDEVLASTVAKLTELTETHGSEAYELAARVAQLDALGSLIGGWALIIIVALAWVGYLIFVRSQRRASPPIDFESKVLVAIPFGVVTVILVPLGLIDVLNPLLYAAASNPDLALARTILLKANLL